MDSHAITAAHPWTCSEQVQTPQHMNTKTLTLHRKKDCKHTIVFDTDVPDAFVRSVYVRREDVGAATAIRLTLEVLATTASHP